MDVAYLARATEEYIYSDFTEEDKNWAQHMYETALAAEDGNEDLPNNQDRSS